MYTRLLSPNRYFAIFSMFAMLGGGTLPGLGAEARELIGDSPLAAFRPVEGWRGVKGVKAVEGETGFVVEGEGRILVNAENREDKAPYLLTREEFGDVRIELEFMVPHRSNSGVYVMGRYEVQIFDSFGRERVGSGDLGGIYARWDPERPEKRQGFGGIAPLSNAAKAPGEWQTMEIVFRAPRFDASGTKVRDALFEEVMINGVVVQRFSPATGPTRSSPLEGEVGLGPIAIQGDHGPIAIRSFKVAPLPDLDATRLAELDAYWAGLAKAIHEGDFPAFADTCHQLGVLVSGTRMTSFPLSQALKRWRPGIEDTAAGMIKTKLDFRFSHRFGDSATAHEAGIFRIVSSTGGEDPITEYIDFEALLIKGDDGWKMIMEYQKGPVGEEKWNELGP